jgi:hypothetical protein
VRQATSIISAQLRETVARDITVDIGAWHLIALNSNCSDAGGCSSSSPQGQWLAADLAAHPNFCTLAYWHIPVFSSGGRASSNMRSIWQTLYNNNVDVVLAGHDHIYERFAPQTADGILDSARGIREFIVGSGGANHTSLAAIFPNSEVRDTSTYGVLKLTLHPTGYDWQFVPEAGKTFTDAGTGNCHGTTSGGTPIPTGSMTNTPTPTSGSSATPTAVSNLFTFLPAADTYIDQTIPGTNYGLVTSVQTDNSPVKHFLLKFNVTGIDNQQIRSAKLRLYNVNASAKGGVFYRVADNTWQENTVTWNNAPAADTTLLASLGAVTPNTWYEVNLTSLITSAGTYSLRIVSTSADGADYSSKEGANPPQLVIETQSLPTSTATYTQTASATPTKTATGTFTPTPTSTMTPTSSGTPTRTQTPAFTATVTSTSTVTATVQPSPTSTFTATATNGPTPTRTPTIQPSFTFTSTNTFTASPTTASTFTSTPTVIATSSNTPTFTPTVRPSTPTSSATPSLTLTSSASPTSTATPTATVTPGAPTGLVASYNFNAGAGTTLIDQSGNNNNGTLTNGPTWTANGKYGTALVFDGLNDRVVVPDSNSLDLTTRLTLEAWVYPTGAMSGWDTILMKEQPPGNLLYVLYANGDTNVPNGRIWIGGEQAVQGTSVLPLNTWSHLALTYDGAMLNFYVNGQLVQSRPQTGSLPVTSAVLSIGNNSIWPDEAFLGRIDEIRIYNEALSQQEVQTDMNTPIN